MPTGPSRQALADRPGAVRPRIAQVGPRQLTSAPELLYTWTMAKWYRNQATSIVPGPLHVEGILWFQTWNLMIHTDRGTFQVMLEADGSGGGVIWYPLDLRGKRGITLGVLTTDQLALFFEEVLAC